MSTDELIREAFERQAATAPESYRIQHTLRQAERAARPKRWRSAGILAVAAAAVAAAVAIPMGVFAGQSAEPGQAPVAQAPQRQAGPALALPYRPEWLPDGFTEAIRGQLIDARGNEGETLARAWRGAPTGDPNNEPTISLSSGAVDGTDDGEAVDINGSPGQVKEYAGDRAIVAWSMPQGERLTVTVESVQAPNAKETALRTARSVTGDSPDDYRPAAAFGWLPDGLSPERDLVRGGFPASPEGTLSPEIWQAELATSTIGGQYSKKIDASVGPNKPAREADEHGANGAAEEKVAVRGQEGVYVAKGHGGELLVRLDDGRWLSVGGEFAKADLVRVADTMEIAPAGPQEWIGAR